MCYFATSMTEVVSDISENEIPVMEHFYSLQGEGHNAGQSAYFIRIAGCDVGCKWCDVKESWQVHPDSSYKVQDLNQYVLQSGARNVVVTGGEPCMYNLDVLTNTLIGGGFKTWLETSGAYPITGKWYWVCLSPKKFKECMPENYKKANELKVVIAAQRDLVWAEKEAKKVLADCKLFLQPEWSVRDEITPVLVDYIKFHPQWSLSLQQHKYIQIP